VSCTCAIGLAVMDVIDKEHATRVGEYLRERLLELRKKRSIIGDIRYVQW
jgi:4-aminobutyrate aminotransferase-like enzyme